MDPRHPELAISRIDELMTQYKRIIRDMQTCSVSSKLAQSEREGGLVVQEICLVAPRLHEAMMQTSRQRRHDLARGILNEPQDTLVEMPHDGYLSVDKAIEGVLEVIEAAKNNADIIGEENIGGESVPMRKLATKNVTKKKSTKKAKK